MCPFDHAFVPPCACRSLPFPMRFLASEAANMGVAPLRFVAASLPRHRVALPHHYTARRLWALPRRRLRALPRPGGGVNPPLRCSAPFCLLPSAYCLLPAALEEIKPPRQPEVVGIHEGGSGAGGGEALQQAAIAGGKEYFANLILHVQVGLLRMIIGGH